MTLTQHNPQFFLLSNLPAPRAGSAGLQNPDLPGGGQGVWIPSQGLAKTFVRARGSHPATYQEADIIKAVQKQLTLVLLQADGLQPLPDTLLQHPRT